MRAAPAGVNAWRRLVELRLLAEDRAAGDDAASQAATQPQASQTGGGLAGDAPWRLPPDSEAPPLPGTRAGAAGGDVTAEALRRWLALDPGSRPALGALLLLREQGRATAAEAAAALAAALDLQRASAAPALWAALLEQLRTLAREQRAQAGAPAVRAAAAAAAAAAALDWRERAGWWPRFHGAEHAAALRAIVQGGG